MLVGIISLLMPQKVSAQSTVYFFIDKVCNLDVFMFKNSEPLFDMVGPITKKRQTKSAMVLPLCTQAPCKRKTVFHATGKSIFEMEATYTNPVNAKTSKVAAEIQLNLTDGAVYYVKIGFRGLRNDMKLELLSDKEAEKILKDKKYVALDDYDEVN